MGEAIAGYWAAVGVETNIIAVEYAAWRAYYTEKPHQRTLGAYGWLFGTKTFNSLRTLGQYASDSPQALLRNPEIDDLLQKANAVRDQNERVQIIRRVADYAYRNFVTIPIAVAPDLYAASSKIAGWEPIEVTGAGLSWETMRRR